MPRSARLDDARARFWDGGSRSRVDVPAVRRRRLSSRRRSRARPGPPGRGRGGAVGAVEDDLQPAGRSNAVEPADREIPGIRAVMRPRGGPAPDGSRTGAVRPRMVLFEPHLPGVRKFESLGGEDLDAVVLEGIVGGGDDDAGREVCCRVR